MKRIIFYITLLSVAITLSGGYLMGVVAVPCVLYTTFCISFKEMVKFCYYREFYKFITKD
jgi:hypothetical protein